MILDFLRHLSYPRVIIVLSVFILVAVVIFMRKIPRPIKIFYTVASASVLFYLFLYLPTMDHMKKVNLEAIEINQKKFYSKYLKEYKEKHPGTLEFISSRNLGHVPVYYINLDRSPARRELFEKRFNDYGISAVRVSAADGKKINKGSNEVDGVKFVSNFSNLTPYEIACTLSHFKAIEQAYNEGHRLAIILEDDVAPDLIPYWDETVHQMIETLPEDWTVINLNPSCDLKKLSSYSKRHCWSAEAYLINRTGMEHLLQFKKGNTWVIPKPAYGHCSSGVSDCIIYTAIPGAYSYNHPLFFSSPLPSDVGNSDVYSYLKSNRKVNKFLSLKNKLRK